MTELVDAAARHRIQTEFDKTFVVEAAAGTGKTTALVGRIVGLIRSGVGRLGQIVAVTFTEKAAGEMKLRLRSEIEFARASATTEERARFELALEELELAHIGTIHSFCGDLLRERPVEARIDPLFEVAADSASRALADEAFEFWFQRVLADPPAGIRRILRRRSRDEPPREALRSALHKLRDHRDFPTAWRRDPFDREGSIDAVMAGLVAIGSLAALSSRADDWLARNLAELERFVAETARMEAVQGRDYDGLEANLREVSRSKTWKWKGDKRTTFGNLSRDVVLARRDEVKAKLDALILDCDADLAPLIHEAMQEAVADYEVLKAGAGQLDFLDLLIRARDLIRDDAVVRADLQKRFTHFFIDEFQDTDPLQVEIMLLLATSDPSVSDWRLATPGPGKLFLVGDPKQSVYRFRRADVALYQQVKERLLGLGAELLHLTTSFRAVPSIQHFINGAFAPVMPSGSDGSQAEYVALQPHRTEVTQRPTIVALPVPQPYGDYGKIVQGRIEVSYPEAVGAFVDWLVNESDWKIEERGQAVPVRPRHIAILSRRFRNFGADVMRPYVRALETRNVPHVLVGGRSFHDREEVIALRNALVAIEWPDDELRVFATLRGPFFALSDEALLTYRQFVGADKALQNRRLDPLHPIAAEELPPIARDVPDALALLGQLHRGRSHRTIAQTVSMLLESVRAHAGTALWPNGEQALANCQRLIDMARHFEHSASSFRSFVEKLENDAEYEEADEAPIVEEGTEGVRIMTVHKAKGLEFPVVILVDPANRATLDKPTRHVDPEQRLWLESLCGCSPIQLLEAAADELRRDQDEAIRLAYVAATRARDLLVIPACGDAPVEGWRTDGWLSVLDEMLMPREGTRESPSPAPGCPQFGMLTVLDRGEKGAPPSHGSVVPGLHRSRTEGPSVVWWDPATLTLEVEEGAPLQYQRLLEADPEGTVAAASEDSFQAWSQARRKLRTEASAPSLSVQTVTALARDEGARVSTGAELSGSPSAALEPRVQIEIVERPGGERPSGRRFGTLVHGILATIDLDANPDGVRLLATSTGRLVGASDHEVEAAIAAVIAALKHPTIRRASASARAGGLRRETPVMVRRSDGTLLEGVVDLAFREETREFSGWTVVDFKTDKDFQLSSDQYASQVQLYMEAVAQVTGASVLGTILVL